MPYSTILNVLRFIQCNRSPTYNGYVLFATGTLCKITHTGVRLDQYDEMPIA